MRKTTKERNTKETKISITLNIDGQGDCEIKTGIDFLGHMLTLFAYHGFFDLKIEAKGDTNIDIHHTNEDIGIVLGQTFKEALGDKVGIKRFGFAQVPMEEVLASVALDICGRGYFNNIILPDESTYSNNERGNNKYELAHANHFFESFAKNMGVNLDIRLLNASSHLHTNLEPIFKAFGLALDQATQLDPRRKEVPSIKGIID